jgi:hypothetical protein
MNKDSKARLARIGQLHKKYQRAAQQLSVALNNGIRAELELFGSLVSQLSPAEQRQWCKRLVQRTQEVVPAFKPRLDDAIATNESTPHGSTKRRHPRKRLRSE